MPIPNLINPVLVTIQPLRRSESLVDVDYNQPVQAARRALTYRCLGQVKWSIDEQVRVTLIGDEAGSTGYIVFRLVDLRAIGLNRLYPNDRFLAIGNGVNLVEFDGYVTGLRYEAHYPDQGGPTLVKAFFADRSPAKGEPTFG